MKILPIYKTKVIEVTDGDTFKGEINLGFDIHITRTFRVFGIDTPEIFRPDSDSERIKGILAKDRATNLLLDKVVEVKLHGTEKYGRSLVEVILPDNQDYTTLMKKEGFVKSSQPISA
jgi:endonuclease YncB( thermonuclease family)